MLWKLLSNYVYLVLVIGTNILLESQQVQTLSYNP